MPRLEGRPGASLPSFDFKKLETDLSESHPNISEYDVMSAALYPQVTEEYLTFREQYGPVDKLDTRIFLVGPKVGEEFDVTIEKGKEYVCKKYLWVIETFFGLGCSFNRGSSTRLSKEWLPVCRAMLNCFLL